MKKSKSCALLVACFAISPNALSNSDGLTWKNLSRCAAWYEMTGDKSKSLTAESVAMQLIIETDSEGVSPGLMTTMLIRLNAEEKGFARGLIEGSLVSIGELNESNKKKMAAKMAKNCDTFFGELEN